jgi:hypothetical protein
VRGSGRERPPTELWKRFPYNPPRSGTKEGVVRPPRPAPGKVDRAQRGQPGPRSVGATQSSRRSARRESGGGTVGVLFLRPDQRAKMRVGLPVHAQIGSSDTYVRGAIAKVEPGLIGPRAAARRYRLQRGSDLIGQPSQAVIVKLGKTLPRTAYDGSRLTAKVEIGSQRLLALFPGLGNLAGGG